MLSEDDNGNYDRSSNWSDCALHDLSDYCVLANGAVIDETHFTRDTAENLWNTLLTARDDYRNTPVILDQASPGFVFTAKYMIYRENLQGLTDSQLAEVGLGIWLDFQVRYETWQAENYGPAGEISSSFHAEDIPSTYLAYVSVVTGKDYSTIINDFGGGTWSTTNKSPDVANPTMYFIVAGNDSKLRYAPYPSSLMITPLINNNYWAFKTSSTPFWSAWMPNWISK